jgi:acetolactate synthase I/II/III large subunit
MNGAQLVVRALDTRGIDTVFGYPGGCIMPLYDALIGSRIRHILCRHEQGAAFAANGFARATGRIGVCIATSGPGATNLITGLADARMDSVPVVALTGQVPSALIGTDAFQETDVLGLSLAVTKHSMLVERVEDLDRILEEAFFIAADGRPGPVLLDLPKDVLLQEPEAGDAEAFAIAPALEPRRTELDAGNLERAWTLLRESHRPVALAGGGIVLANAIDEFRGFVETADIPTALTLKGIGTLPDAHPLNVGMLGMHGSVAANETIQACDLIVCVGARFDDRVTGRLDTFAPGASVIHLDIDPAEVSKLRPADCPLIGDLRESLAALTIPLDHGEWADTCRAHRTGSGFQASATAEGIEPAGFLQALNAAAGSDAVIACDVGQHQMWVAQHYPFDHPRRHLSSGGLGAMGFGLPAAIGAQLALPGATVVNVSGDGSFMMNLQELATLTRYGIPVKMVIFDNSGLGMVRQQQEVCYDGRYTQVDLSDNPDFVAIARAFGIPAWHVDPEADPAGVIREWLGVQGPALLHLSIHQTENVWPMVKPGDGNDDMITGAAA